MPSKKIRLRLYADENFPVSSATFLKSIGVSLVHAFDLKLVNKGDKTHINKAKKLQRTIITIDRDFLYYSAITTRDSFGAIVISTGNATPDHINLICQKTLHKISEDSIKGAFAKVTIEKITIVKNKTVTKKSY